MLLIASNDHDSLRFLVQLHCSTFLMGPQSVDSLMAAFESYEDDIVPV